MCIAAPKITQQLKSPTFYLRPGHMRSLKSCGRITGMNTVWFLTGLDGRFDLKTE